MVKPPLNNVEISLEMRLMYLLIMTHIFLTISIKENYQYLRRVFRLHRLESPAPAGVASLEKLHGKELSYNNLLDVDAAVNLMEEFKNDKPTFAILKHNNACGLATRDSIEQAYKDALAGDPVSAFGGILISNKPIDLATANHINELFCEVVIAPNYADDALELLKSKKNRIILVQ